MSSCFILYNKTYEIHMKENFINVCILDNSIVSFLNKSSFESNL